MTKTNKIIHPKQRKWLRDFEKKLGINASEAPLLIGVSYSTYMKWRSGTQQRISNVALRSMFYALWIHQQGLDIPLQQATNAYRNR